MTDAATPSTPSPSSQTNAAYVRRTSFAAGATIAAIVALRFITGLHFYAEGSKKFAYNVATGERRVTFTSAPFMKGAVGPWADFYHSQVPGFHDWEKLIAQPRSAFPNQSDDAAEEQHPVYQEWLDRIRDDFKKQQAAVAGLRGLHDEQKEASLAIYEQRVAQVENYLEGEADAIAEYQHELWRLQKWEATPGSDEIPFREERIAEKRAELAAKPRSWVSELEGVERGYHNDLKALVTSEQQAAGSDLETRITTAVTDPVAIELAHNDKLVAYGITAIGVLLMFGLFTRIAALAGAVFLLMVMGSQPPWVEGARADLFYYQLVEVVAFLVLIFIGAGRWAGLDSILGGMWNKFRGVQA